MTFEDLILEFGGKTSSVLAQIDNGNADMVFPASPIKPKLWDNFPDFTYKYLQIARGSVVGDEKAFVDVIKSYPKLNLLDLNKDQKFNENKIVDINEKLTNLKKTLKDFKTDLKIAEDTQDFDECDSIYENIAPIERMIIGSENSLNEIAQFPQNRSKIDLIIHQSKLEDVIEYANYEGFNNYSGVSSVLIQPQNRIDLRGSIIEHPNIEGHYLINIVNEIFDAYGSLNIKYIDQYLVDWKSKVISSSNNDSGQFLIKESSLVDIVEMKKRSRKVSFIDEKYSSQVEFGFLNNTQDFESSKYEYSTKPSNPVIFYQEKEFCKFDYDSRIDPKKYKFNHFGIIPDEGLELRLYPK